MKKVLRLISEISPSIALPGVSSLAYAILFAEEIVAKCPPDDPIRIIDSVYSPAAAEVNKSLDAVIKSISRATRLCWMNGNNHRLNEIIGKKLPVKPTPKEFVLYCAYYIVYNKPCHNPDGPIIF